MAGLTDEEQKSYATALSVRHGIYSPLEYLVAIDILKRIIDRLQATPARTADVIAENDKMVVLMSDVLRKAQNDWFDSLSELAKDTLTEEEQTWLHALLMLRVTDAIRSANGGR